MKAALALGSALFATGAAAELSVVSYDCEHGARIEVAYVTEAEVAVLDVEGGLRALQRRPSATGVRYSVPAGQSGHVWWTKGGDATLAWFDAEIGEEVMLYIGCQRAD